MVDPNVNVINGEDDMAFYRTLLKYMKKMKPLANFEFRQAMMVIVKKYAYKNELASAISQSLKAEFELKEEPREKADQVLREIQLNFQQLDAIERRSKGKSANLVEPRVKIEKSPDQEEEKVKRAIELNFQKLEALERRSKGKSVNFVEPPVKTEKSPDQEEEQVKRNLALNFKKLDEIERQSKRKAVKQSPMVSSGVPVKEEEVNAAASAFVRGFLYPELIQIEASDESDSEPEQKPVSTYKKRRTL